MNQAPAAGKDRDWAIYAQAAGLLLMTNVPLANAIVPFIMYLRVKSDPSMPFARAHAAASFNFQATCTIVLAALAVTGFWLFARSPYYGGSGAALAALGGYVAVALFDVVFTIVAAVRAADAKPPWSPFAIRFVR